MHNRARDGDNGTEETQMFNIDGKKVELVLETLKQPSTYKGLLGLAGLIGVHFAPEQYQEIVAGIGTVYFLISIFWQKS
jgi:hypothetical protein